MVVVQEEGDTIQNEQEADVAKMLNSLLSEHVTEYTTRSNLAMVRYL